MTSSAGLRPALVLRTTEEICSVVTEDGPLDAAFAPFFPAPRVERVSPGHLVALADDLVVWRWFDAVVLGASGGEVRLWEPGHGEVVAQPRDPSAERRPGSRAYLSAGLPGAEWWVAGPVTARPGEADVELDDVRAFLAEHELLAD